MSALAAAALLIEAAVGYPDWLFRAIRHPVVWIGALIAALDARLPRTRLAGAGALALVLAAAIAAGLALQAALPLLLLAPLASTLLAQRSLHQHVAAVARALGAGLEDGRTAVAHIVGRDPASLDAPAIARAAIESLAENFSDGVVAPAVWCAAAGMPGLLAYKACNTADSMIGHRTQRHERFGWAAARTDDWLNLVPSRLSGLLLVAAAALLPGADPAAAWRAMRRDARHHRSPSAGWPEAALAGALGLRIGGPRAYGGVMTTDGFMGDGRAACTPADIARALALYRTACALQIGILATLAAALS